VTPAARPHQVSRHHRAGCRRHHAGRACSVASAQTQDYSGQRRLDAASPLFPDGPAGSRRQALAGTLGAALLAASAGVAPALAAVPSCPNVVIEDIVVGKGASPTVGVQITVAYVGKAVEKGIVIDSTYKGVMETLEPYDFRFGVGTLIKGVEYGIAGMKVGGKRKITIPPGDCGLQSSLRAAPGRPAISKDVTLEYVVELLTIAGEYEATELGAGGGGGEADQDTGRRNAKDLFQDESVSDPEFQF